MDRISGAARRAALLAVALGSVGVCGVLTWYAISPGVIGRLGTGHLMVLLGLFLLPPFTFLAWRWEREHWADAREPACDAMAASQEVRHAHPAHREESGTRQHRRRAETTRIQ